MKLFLISLLVAALLFVPVYADRVVATFDPNANGMTLKFDTNSVATDNFFSPLVLFSADGKKGFVNFPGSDSLVVFDTDSMQVLASLAVGKTPSQMSLTPDHKTVITVNTDLADKVPVAKLVGGISLIDVETLAVKTVAFDKVDFSLASNIIFTADGLTGIVASTGTDEIVRFKVADGSEITPRLKLPGGSRPVGLTMSHDGTFFTAVNVADQQFSTTKDSVSIIDVSTFQVRATMNPKDPHDFLATHRVALSLDDTKGIIGDDANKGILGVDVVYIFDTKTGDVIKSKEVGINANYTALTPDGSRFVVVSEFGITLLPVDNLDSATDITPPAADLSRATNIVFTADSKTAFLAGSSADLLYRIDLQTNAVVADVDVGKDPATFTDSPFFVALAPDEQRVAVVNFGSNTISFVTRTFALGTARFYSNPSRFTGLALANVGTTPINLKLEALSTGGVAFKDDPQTTDVVEVVNPQSLDLAPGQQTALLASELFQSDPAKSPIDGWISIDSSQQGLIGFFEIGDAASGKLDGANLITHGELVTILPVVRQNDQFSTELVVVNPNFNSATVTIDLVDNGGNVVRTISDSLPGLAVLSRKLKSSDSGAADLLPEAAGLDGAHLVITGSIPVAAFALYETVHELSVLPAIAPASTANDNGTNLVAPQVAILGGFRTVVSLVNVSGQDADITLTLMGNDGVPLAAAKTVTVADKASAVLDLAELFELRGNEPVSGWLTVTSTGTPIVGAVELFFDDAAMSAFALTKSSGTDFHFAHISQGGGFATGLALVNPNAQAAQVTIDVFDPSGALITTKKIALPAKSRISDVVASLLGLTSQIGGRIHVQSDVPIVGLELFFTTDLSTLSVVPPQTIQ
ncbi:MAG TPA: hypothetical protein VGL91_04500 [Acidobacteriota bacterium]